VTPVTRLPALPPSSRLKEGLKWLAPISLAMLVVCVGCFFFFAFGLTARGELTTSALGTDFRLWLITDQRQTGVGLQRSFGVQHDGQACRHFDVTILLWRPRVSIENVAYDDCS
jgi:hypothetical protein